MLELLENLFPVLITVIGLFYIIIALLVARAIGYKGLGFKLKEISTPTSTPTPTSTSTSTSTFTNTNNNKFSTCNECLDYKHKNKKSNILFKHFNIKKNAIIVIWLSFILGCLFLGNQITGYLDFLTSIDLIGKLIVTVIFFAVGVNARLLIKIFDRIKNDCETICEEHFRIDLIKSFKDIKATSFVIYIILTFTSFFVLFGKKAIKKVSTKKK